MLFKETILPRHILLVIPQMSTSVMSLIFQCYSKTKSGDLEQHYTIKLKATHDWKPLKSCNLLLAHI